MIADSVAFCREQGKRVIYDAEHFFDGYRDDPGYALECLRAAVEAGAENVTLCDTNGGSLPDQVGAVDRRRSREQLGAEVEIGIHTHNDAECGVANSLAAVDAGARAWCRGRSTATASAAATPTWSRSCRRCS